MITLKRDYPPTVFSSLWKFLGSLAEDGRLWICEEARDECHDDDLQDFFKRYPDMVVLFGDIQAHFARLVAELDENDLSLVDPQSTRNRADPHVVATALALEGREHLGRRVPGGPVCAVITYEKARNAPNSRAKIPDVCSFYDIECMRWPQVLSVEGFQS